MNEGNSDDERKIQRHSDQGGLTPGRERGAGFGAVP